MAWVDYKKANYMVPHSWLLEVVEMMGVAGNVRTLLGENMIVSDSFHMRITINLLS